MTHCCFRKRQFGGLNIGRRKQETYIRPDSWLLGKNENLEQYHRHPSTKCLCLLIYCNTFLYKAYTSRWCSKMVGQCYCLVHDNFLKNTVSPDVQYCRVYHSTFAQSFFLFILFYFIFILLLFSMHPIHNFLSIHPSSPPPPHSSNLASKKKTLKFLFLRIK